MEGGRRQQAMEYHKGDNIGNMMSDVGIQDNTVDWRGRTSKPKHGGMRAAAFVLGIHGSLSLSLWSFLNFIIF